MPPSLPQKWLLRGEATEVPVLNAGSALVATLAQEGRTGLALLFLASPGIYSICVNERREAPTQPKRGLFAAHSLSFPAVS